MNGNFGCNDLNFMDAKLNGLTVYDNKCHACIRMEQDSRVSCLQYIVHVHPGTFIFDLSYSGQ